MCFHSPVLKAPKMRKPRRTKIRIVAEPSAKGEIHQIIPVKPRKAREESNTDLEN